MVVAGLPESESHHTSTDSGALTGQTLESDPRSISYSSSTDINCSSSRSSCDTWTGSSSGSKPHKANDAGWEAIRSVKSKNGNQLGLGHFRLMHKLGSGDIGSVYLTELRGTECYFAMKVMDKKALTSRNKLLRAQTEREILEMLDHPFLPTLYAHLETPQFSCLVMEFCPGGDLHVLRQRQPGKRFSEHAARFYASEVLLTLEYLHMMGIIYRDLKPENVLVREDGHIMLTDFDLSLKCSVRPKLLRPTARAEPSSSTLKDPPPPPAASCILPSCVLPCTTTTQQQYHHHQRPIVSCLPMFHRFSRKKPRPKQRTPLRSSDLRNSSVPELLAEPTDARSMSFVGTHEYLAPEIIVGEGHGSAVDWWTLGIFLYELLYGRTPFRGSDNEKTLGNVVSQPLEFPSEASNAARDLIGALLVKDPSKRMASSRGATEIKQHPFFAGLNWALIRCSIPPEIPSPFNPPPPRCTDETDNDDDDDEGHDNDREEEHRERPSSGTNFEGKGSSSDFEYF